MSNSKTFGETKIPKIRFLSVEHGQSHITLSIIESNPHKFMEIMLNKKDAGHLAVDLVKRTGDLVDGGS